MKWNPTPEGIVTGIGLTVASAVLFPVLREIAKPIAAAGAQSVATLSHQVKSGVAYVREELEDLVAEAQWERLKQSIDLEMAEGEGNV